MRIDPKSSTPVFRQIVEEMQSSIAAGVYQPGETIPSTRNLAIELKVNPNTVQKAYEELVNLGVLESRRGLGKVVASRGGKSALQQSEKAVLEAFRRGVDLARSAGLSNRRIRELLNDCLQSSLMKARA